MSDIRTGDDVIASTAGTLRLWRVREDAPPGKGLELAAELSNWRGVQGTKDTPRTEHALPPLTSFDWCGVSRGKQV